MSRMMFPLQQASAQPRFVGHTPSQFEDTECVVCHEQLVPPVYQCCNGHLVCSGCCDEMEESGSACSACQGDMPYPRVECLFFKQIARRLQYICPHDGCNARLRSTDFNKHKDSCDWRPFQCGYCEDSFCVDYMGRHMRDKHRDVVTVLGPGQIRETLTCVSVEGRITCPEAQICYRNKMLVILDIASDESGKNNTYYAFPVVLAPSENSVRCKLSFEKEDRRLTWEGKPYSYEAWLEGYDAMIGEGRPFPIAVDGDYCWSDEADTPRFSYRLDILLQGVAQNTARRLKLRPDTAGSTSGVESLASTIRRPLSARSSPREGYDTRPWK